MPVMATFTLKWDSVCWRCGVKLNAKANVRWHHAFGHSCRDSEACEKRKTKKTLDKV